MTIAARQPLAILIAAALAFGLSACQSPKVSDGKTPEQVLAGAKQQLDETSGVVLSLSTEELPQGVPGLESAAGTATRDPAFDGTLGVSLGNTIVQVPVIAVDGKVWAQLPFTDGWQEVDPARYQAPDPAQLIGDNGISALLPATTGVEEGETVRGGKDNTEVLTTFTGTVPGDLVTDVLPTATGDTFEAEYQINAEGQLRTAELTGVFYEGQPALTYTVDFSEYGTTRDIVAP